MNTDDRQLLDDLEALPGWADFSAIPAPPIPAGLLERIATDLRAVGRDGIAEKVPTSRLRSRRTVLAAVACAALVAVGIAAPTVNTPGHGPASVATASEFLTRLAASTTTTAGVQGAYWMVRTNTQSADANGRVSDTLTTMWFGRQGGRWISVGDDPVVKATSAKAPFVIAVHRALTWDQVAALPSDVGALEQELLRMTATPIVVSAAKLLTTAPLDAAQRSAVLMLLARQPNTTMSRDVHDMLGRAGTAVVFPYAPDPGAPASTATLVFADDGTVLEWWYTSSPVTGASDGRSPIVLAALVLDRTTYISAGGTDVPPWSE
jgi:hypothetical protein